MQIRMRDKQQMARMIEEPTTLQLFRDLFTIFYEPLVRVYKSANVYSSVTDFAKFADDAIQVIDQCQRQDVAADPNQTVQSFIDLCQRHEHNFYKFVHEVHVHDNGLFGQLMTWLEGILTFLRNGPPSGGKLDMNALFAGAVEQKLIDPPAAVREINTLIRWQEKRKKWHADKTRQKMAAQGGSGDEGGPSPDGLGIASGFANSFKPSDFGLHALDLQDLDDDDEESSSDEEGEEDMADPIAAERKRRRKRQDVLRRTAGEPKKPEVKELNALRDGFLAMLRGVLAE